MAILRPFLKPYQNTKGQTLSKMQNTQLNHFFPPIPSKQFEFYVDPFSRSSVIRLCTFLFHICFVKSMGETFFLVFDLKVLSNWQHFFNLKNKDSSKKKTNQNQLSSFNLKVCINNPYNLNWTLFIHEIHSKLVFIK